MDVYSFMASDFRYRNQYSFSVLQPDSVKIQRERDIRRISGLATGLLSGVGGCFTRNIAFLSRKVSSLYSAVQTGLANSFRRELTTAELVESYLLPGETKDNVLKISQLIDDAVAFRNMDLMEKIPNIALKNVKSKRRKGSSDNYMFWMMSMMMFPTLFLGAFARKMNDTTAMPVMLSRLDNDNKYIVDIEVEDSWSNEYEYRYNITANDTLIDEEPFGIYNDLSDVRPTLSFWIMDPLRLDEDGVLTMKSCDLYREAWKVKTKIVDEIKCRARIHPKHGNNTYHVQIVPQEDPSVKFGVSFTIDSENFYIFRIKMIPDVTEPDNAFNYRFLVSPDNKKVVKRKRTLSLTHNATAHMLAYIQGPRREDRRKTTTCQVLSDTAVAPNYTFQDNQCEIVLSANSSLTQYDISLTMVHRRSELLTLDLQLDVETILPPVTEKPAITLRPSTTEKPRQTLPPLVTENPPWIQRPSTTNKPSMNNEHNSRENTEGAIYGVPIFLGTLLVAGGAVSFYCWKRKKRQRRNLQNVAVLFAKNNLGVKNRDIEKQTMAAQFFVDTLSLKAQTLTPEDIQNRKYIIVDSVLKKPADDERNITKILRRGLLKILNDIPEVLRGSDQEQQLIDLKRAMFESSLTSEERRDCCAMLLDIVLKKIKTVLDSSRVTINTSVVDVKNKFIPNMWARGVKKRGRGYAKNRKDMEKKFIDHSGVTSRDNPENIDVPLLYKATPITRPVYGAIDYKGARHGGAPLYGVHYYVIKDTYKSFISVVPGQVFVKKSPESFCWNDLEGLLIYLMTSDNEDLLENLINDVFYPEQESDYILNKYGLRVDRYLETLIYASLPVCEAVEEFHVFTDPVFEMADSPVDKSRFPKLTAIQKKNIEELQDEAKSGRLAFKLFVDECEIKEEEIKGDINSQQNVFHEMIEKGLLVKLSENEKKALPEQHYDYIRREAISNLPEDVVCYMFFDGNKKIYMTEEYISGTINAKGYLTCPVTNRVIYRDEGPCPDGFMTISELKNNAGEFVSLPGHADCHTLKIDYMLFPGIQSEKHLRCGVPYPGRRQPAYLPNNDEGKKTAQMLQEAFVYRETFTVGQSRTNHTVNVIVWNDIHHRTSLEANHPYGYPAPNYFADVKDELIQRGIKYPSDTPTNHTLLRTVDNSLKRKLKVRAERILLNEQNANLQAVEAARSESSSPQPGPSGLQTIVEEPELAYSADESSSYESGTVTLPI